MTDSSEIGRYGTLRLLKRHEPETTVAFFPIDDEKVTFGRSKQCSVRLYYDCVSELHCTLQFSEEHKAFLLVQGTNGLLVDGCQVYPSSSPASGPTTVPLTNGSEIEIYKKRFKFEYPPKEIRAALLATPRNTKARRSLRMSMIRSAQVFTPRGSADAMPQTPRRGDLGRSRDWEALRSPIKVPSQDGSPDQEMMLLEGEGDDAFVVEEEKDLIILEKVDNLLQQEPKSNRGRSVAFSIPAATPPPKPVPIPQSARILQHTPPITLANRRRSAPSLHRAVVLRSAQRALQREQERFEEELEEDEVEAEVSPERDLGPFEIKGEDDEDEENGKFYRDQDEEHDEEPVQLNTHPVRPARRMSAFRASIDAMRKVIPLPFNWKAPEDVPLPEENDDEDAVEENKEKDGEEGERDDEYKEHDDNDDDLEDEHEPAFQTPIRRNLGPFMTPQVQFNRPAQRIPIDVKARVSIGGEGVAQKTVGGAQRVRVVPAWKVTDIVLPEPEKSTLGGQKTEITKERISDEERQAILARRKSALHTPSALPMPGPRVSAFPPIQNDAYTPGEDSDEDADTMLERMKQKMADVRLKSEARKTRISIGIRQQGEEFSLLAPGTERKDRGFPNMGIAEETLSQMKRAEVSNLDIGKPSLEAAGSKSRIQDRDSLDLLQASSDEENYEPVAGAAPRPGASSLTPRFDGVREMFRQPRVEPKTPSFAGFKAMFQERSEAVAKTPSFRGVREMFSRAGTGTGLATPRLDLGEMFDEEESVDSEEHRTTDEDSMGMSRTSTSRPKLTTVSQSEDEDPVASTPAPKMSTRPRKAAASTSKRPLRKKDVPPVDVPSAVAEEAREDEDNDVEEVEPMPAPTILRVAKRSAKNNTTPTTGDAPLSNEGSGRGASRNTRKTTASQSTTKGIVVHKTTKNRRIADDDSEEEEEQEPSKAAIGRTKSTGRGKRKNQQASESEIEPERNTPEEPVRVKARSRKAKGVETSDSEEVAAPKARRARAIKTPQAAEDIEIPPVPQTKGRRVKVEESSDAVDLAPAAKAPKSKRGAKTKVPELVDESPIRTDDYSSEDATPAPNKGKKGRTKKTPVPKDTVSHDKENSGDQQPKSSDKAPAAARTRRAAAAPVDAVDAPAKRTRSRK